MIRLPSVSVIVSTYTENRLGYVLDCLRSLKAQSLEPEEIILVVDRSENLEGFYKNVVPQGVKLIVSKGFGLSNARNSGIKSSKGEFIAFIDDDAVADTNWLQNMVRNYVDSDVIGVGGLVKAVWESGQPLWFPDELNWIVGCSYDRKTKRTWVRNPIGCNMSFRRRVFDEVGYFSSEFGRYGSRLITAEESDFCMRIHGMIVGAKICFDPLAVVYHKIPHARSSLKYLAKRSFYEGLSKALIFKRTDNLKQMKTEREYLKQLLVRTHETFRKPEPRNICRSGIILFSTFLVASGYLVGKS